MDRPTVDVYDARADAWVDRRGGHVTPVPSSFTAAVATARHDGVTGPVADLGCGPGWHTGDLAPDDGPPAVALDAAAAMLTHVGRHAPGALRVRADLGALPFGDRVLGGAWASRSYVHVARRDLPMALAQLHRALAPGAPVRLHLFGGDAELDPLDDDDFGGRRFSRWDPDRLVDVLVGAGFVLDRLDVAGRPERLERIDVAATRRWSLPDTVGPGLRLLVCGLNPSPAAADAGIGFARPGNRFWPAARAAGLVDRDRDPVAALVDHGVGMTDLVKRTTARAAELEPDEYREGLARVERLVRWLEPAAVVFVGLAGWRAAVDRRAGAGIQPTRLADVPVYVMPSTSGLNASSRLEDLVAHLEAVRALPGVAA